MSVLGADAIGELLGGYLGEALPAWEQELAARPQLLGQMEVYLDLLVRWNGWMNLSAVREPREMVRRHFAESLFAAVRVGEAGDLLDFGSGAGFPGLPIQLWWPGKVVTLAESQGKKATFLREVVRTLGLPTEVWAGRVEGMPEARSFGSVVMRAVDAPRSALLAAFGRTRTEVWVLGSGDFVAGMWEGVEVLSRAGIPGTEDSFLFQLRGGVPRGT